MYIKWVVYFIPAIFIELICYFTNPIVCLFTTKSYRTDVVKREGKVTKYMPREYLIPIFYLWQTHDNAVDEGWYGLYDIPFLKNKTQKDYDESWLIRYWCRVWWLSRNTAYGWTYKLLSVPVEPVLEIKEVGEENKTYWRRLSKYKSSFQLELHVPISSTRYLSINIGWKGHKGLPNKLYANRLIGIRKY